MTPTNKSPIQDEPKKPTFVALIKKNKPEPTLESTPKPEETSPNKTSSQSLGKKSTNSTTKSKQTTASTSSTAKSQQSTASTSSTTKSKQTTASTSSKQTEKTTTSKATEKSQSTITPKAASQSSSKTSSKKPSNQTSKTQEITPLTASRNRITASQNNQKGQGKFPKSQSTTNNKPQSTISQKTEDKAQSTISQKTEDKAQSTTNKKTQGKSPTSQLKNANIDPIQKALLYKNEKKERLGISDYQDLLSARDISLSIAGLSSIAAGSALQALLAGSLMGIFSFPALLLLSTVLGKYVLQFHRTAVDILREEEAERKIAQLLKDTYLDNGGEIYSLLDDNPLTIPNPDEYEPNYLDIGLCLPSGQSLAISVKALKGKKDFVYIDQKTNILRYRNPRGLAKWGLHPLDELKQQIGWLRENTKTFKGEPLKILVFMEPTRVKLFDEIALKFGETKVLCLDDIYIVQEKDLLDFIDAVQSRGKV